MKFLALISGGKDSIFNIMKCIENGHELVLLINLYPESNCVINYTNKKKDQGYEKDSYMYQTVGANIIDVVA